jgi:hypothetical protein
VLQLGRLTSIWAFWEHHCGICAIGGCYSLIGDGLEAEDRGEVRVTRAVVQVGDGGRLAGRGRTGRKTRGLEKRREEKQGEEGLRDESLFEASSSDVELGRPTSERATMAEEMIERWW